MSRRSAIVVGLAVVATLVLGGFWLHFAQEPPAVAAGVHRFTVEPFSHGANSMGHVVQVGDREVWVKVGGVWDDGAQLGVQVPDGAKPPAAFGGMVHRGDSFDVGTDPGSGNVVVGGVHVDVMEVWKMPDSGRSAVDLRFTAR